jgi:hypothetical protein
VRGGWGGVGGRYSFENQRRKKQQGDLGHVQPKGKHNHNDAQYRHEPIEYILEVYLTAASMQDVSAAPKADVRGVGPNRLRNAAGVASVRPQTMQTASITAAACRKKTERVRLAQTDKA